VTETWATPGGSPGTVLATATWESGDTLRIVHGLGLGSRLGRHAAARFGGMVQVTSPGERIFFHALSFQFDVRPVDADTVVPAGAS
jgi:hypothetical protein